MQRSRQDLSYAAPTGSNTFPLPNHVIVIGVIFAAVIALVALMSVVSYVSAANSGNESERRLTAMYENNQNILGQYTIKVQEMAQVPDMYRDDLKEVIAATFQGRYGEGGSKATWQWLKEQNPNLDPGLYNRLQQTMEAGRNQFTVSQTELLDMKRKYETDLGYVWRGFWLKQAGYPKINLDEIKVVKAGNTEAVFEAGVDEGIKLRKKE